MAVPKRKTSKARKRQRRAHHALTAPAHSTCPNCQAPTIPHRICANCGSYKGEVIVAIGNDWWLFWIMIFCQWHRGGCIASFSMPVSRRLWFRPDLCSMQKFQFFKATLQTADISLISGKNILPLLRQCPFPAASLNFIAEPAITASHREQHGSWPGNIILKRASMPDSQHRTIAWR